MKFGRKPKDLELNAEFSSERFRMVPCSFVDAFQISYLWNANPEILRNITFDSRPRSKVQWYRQFTRPDGHKNFVHGIVPKSGKGAIGLHIVALNDSGVATPSIALHAKSWWGKGVFAEVRRAAMDHFFTSDRVNKFTSMVSGRNMASIFNYRALGLNPTGTLRQHRRDPADDTYHDIIIFEVLKEDWPLPAEGAA